MHTTVILAAVRDPVEPLVEPRVTVFWYLDLMPGLTGDCFLVFGANAKIDG